MFIALALTVSAFAACPGSRQPASSEDARRALLDGETAQRYRKRVEEAAGGPLTSLERAALGLLWLKDGRHLRAIVDLDAVRPRDLPKFERKLFFLVRGLASYSRGWTDLAARDFREAELITLSVEEVNAGGENTEPMLIADLLVRAAGVLATADEGLARVSLGPVEDASGLIGDVTILHYVEAEVARRRGQPAKAVAPAEALLPSLEGDDASALKKTVDAQKSGGETGWAVLGRPGIPIGLAERLLRPLLPATKAAKAGGPAFEKASKLKEKVDAGEKG